ncbi:MAG: response regulator transcription factor [Eubacteriales bacterium]|nr:response regulator transcription factor [Eubacteriales bacterium]
MKYNILYVEDDPVIGEVIEEYLKTAGYHVHRYLNGNEALSAFAAERFDLAILDIMLPDTDGIDILKHLRTSDPDIGIIMLSALDDEGTQLHAFNGLCDDYIVKPVSGILLLKRVETILRRTARPATPHPDGLSLDTAAYAFYEDGQKVPLTVTEYLILAALYKRPGKVFTRAELLNLVYDTEYYGSDRVIDSHIKNIRKKLRTDIIETVIGLGYRRKESYETE